MEQNTNPPKTSPPTNKPKKLSLKDKEYLKNLKARKYNQTKAYQDTYPNASYGVARKNGSIKTKKVAESINPSIEHITAEYILDNLELLACKSRKEADRIRAWELLGKWKALFTDKIQTKDTTITPQMEDNIRNYIQTNRLN